MCESLTDRRFGFAWLTFAAALALHVADEATHDFLSFYNPFVIAVKTRVSLPFPTFTFKVWITGLIFGILLLVCLSALAFRGARWLRIVAVPLAIVVGVLNASVHIAGSFYYGRFLPGVYSSPMLFIAAVALLLSVRTTHQKASRASAGG